MYCTKKVLDDLIWVGANDRRLSMFEGVYSVPRGVSYNSFLLLDDVNVLFDTVDKAVSGTFFQNIEHALNGKKLDFVVIQHMEPDHSATLTELMLRYPDVKIVCNQKVLTMIDQFFNIDLSKKAFIVKEGDTLNTGHHVLKFIFAPMVHWPEVMITYDETSRTLFSADAFGTFGAMNGAIFADEVDFDNEYMDEARRYYCNIVGKYGPQVQSMLKKVHGLDIKMICPLHGFVWRRNLEDYFDKYVKWSTYTPEETGVMIAYASVYGNTENTAEIISSRLRDMGIKTVMFDVSVTPASEIIAAAFKWSHLLFASTTYNAGIFVSMEELLNDLAAHNIQNRTVAFVENGSWAPTSGGLMKKIISECKDMTILEETLTLKSSLKPEQDEQINALVNAISATIPRFEKPVLDEAAMAEATVDPTAFQKLSYGLFVLSAKADSKDNGCIINTAAQLTSSPNRINIAVNKANYTHDMILNTGIFNISVLAEDTSFDTFKRFGFASGKDTDKFADFENSVARSANGLLYVTEGTNAFMSAKVVDSYDYGTHTLFIAEITEAEVLREEPSVTYAYYFEHIKPKPQPKIEEEKHGYVCKICGYVYEGDSLPDDFICPLCKHGVDDFEKI
ncbi:MAG: flavin reductase [Anaerovoracaceae bacterium]|nr:flavin reductase [Bacillota bacterium]MEE0516528.1 flavin reductase [Anaerovoracaceae bacterium]